MSKIFKDKNKEELVNISVEDIKISGEIIQRIDKNDCYKISDLTKRLTYLLPAVAMVLSEFKGRELDLNGLTSITEEVAKALSQFKGKLDLNGLTSITEEAAIALPQFFKGLALFLKLFPNTNTEDE